MDGEPQVALVTGASRGIGNYLARHFLANGYTVVGCSRSAPEEMDSPRYEHHGLDVASEPDVVELFRLLRQDHGHLDVVINNAACNPASSLAPLTAGSAAEEVLNTNVLGTFLVCREAIKLMMRRKFGRIVNFGSMATRHEVAGEALYTASKAAVNAMTRVLAKETARYGITCNVVARRDRNQLDAADRCAKGARASQAEREAGDGRSEGSSDTVDWLVSPAGSAVTGQLIYLGGA